MKKNSRSGARILCIILAGLFILSLVIIPVMSCLGQ